MKRIIFLTVLFLSSISGLYPQDGFKELSRLKINFANGIYIREFYRFNNILFALTDKSYEDYCVSAYDISDIKSPVELGRWDKESYSGDARYAKYVSYIKDTLLAFPFYAVSSDTSPDNIIHYFWKPDAVISIGDIFFSFRGNNCKVKAFRISNSTLKTELISTLEIPALQGEITGIAAVDNVIYLASRSARGNPSLIMVDASDPFNLKELQSPLQNEDLTGMASGNEKILIGKDFRELLVFEGSDPKNPKLVKTFNYFHNRLKGYWQNGIYYLVGEDTHITLFDKDVNLIKEIPTKGNVYSAEPDSASLILGSSAGIEIYNVSNLNNPFVETIYGANVAKAVSIVKNGNYLYTVNLGDGLKIIDVSDSTKPKLAGTLNIKGYTRAIALSEGYAFLADYTKGLLITDILDVFNPRLISTLTIPAASELDAAGNKVYLVTDENKFYAIDITNKKNPAVEYSEIISTPVYQDLGKYKKIKTAGSNIWMTFYEDSLYAFQYSDKTLQKTFSYKSPYVNWPSELKLQDSMLFLASLNTRIFNPYTQKLIGQTDSTFPTQIISTAFDERTKILYTLEVVDWGVGIHKYDLAVPSNPKRLSDYLGFEFLPEKILIDKGLLYVLAADEIIIYSLDNTQSVVEENNTGRAQVFNYKLEQNYPNPFNPSTEINYSISENNIVTLKVYDILGNETDVLVNKYQSAGSYKVIFDGSSLPSGVYIYTLQAGRFRDSKKLLLVK